MLPDMQGLAEELAFRICEDSDISPTDVLNLLNRLDEVALTYLHELLPRLDKRQKRLLRGSFQNYAKMFMMGDQLQRRLELSIIAVDLLSPSRWLWTDSDVDGVARAMEMAEWKDTPLRSTLSNEVCAGMLIEVSALGHLNEWSGRKWDWLAAHVAELEPLRGKFSDHDSIEPDFCELVLAGSPPLREGFL